MTDDATPSLDIATFYGPLVGRAARSLLLRACDEVDDFRVLAQRPSSARLMAAAIDLVVSAPTDVDEWIVKVTAHYLDSLVERDSSRLLETIAHEDFLLGVCHGYNSEYVASVCPLRDGRDASEWLEDTGTNSVRFTNVLVRDYFVARHIVGGNTNIVLRLELPKRWVLLFLALLAPGLLTNMAAQRTDRLRAEIESEIESEVEQKVQAALSHQLKRSAGAVRSHLKSIRRKLPPSQFEHISAEFDRIVQEIEFQIALSERTSKWSIQPELHIEDIVLLPEIESVLAPLQELFPAVSTAIDASSGLVSRCDRQLFREAFYCLAENAFQAASTGRGSKQHVDVRGHQVEGHLTIRIEVLDSGVGVHPDDHGRIFQPRVTTKKGSNGHPLGTGMGLPIARKYAELMGGRIDIDGQAARTCFFIELPSSPENKL